MGDERQEKKVDLLFPVRPCPHTVDLVESYLMSKTTVFEVLR